MAALFGVTPSVAAFWMAFRFAHLFRRLLGEGALNTVFIPHFEALRARDPERARGFFQALSFGLLGVLLCIVVLGEVVLGGFLVWGSLSPATQEVVRLTMLLLPALLFISLYGLNLALLNCENSYFLPSVAPAVFNLFWIGTLFFLRGRASEEAMRLLAMLLVFGFALQWIVTLPRVLSFLSFTAVKGTFYEVVRMLPSLGLGMLGVGAVQINTLLDALFARAALLEGPAILWYALRLQQLPFALLSIALATALLPAIARALQEGREAQYRELLSYALMRAVGFMVPVTALLCVLGVPIVTVVYGRGEFSGRDLMATGQALWAYGMALLPMTGVVLLSAAFYAVRDFRTPTWISLFCVVLNGLLNALFVYAFEWGAVSIALATAFSSLVNALLLLAALQRAGRMVNLQPIGLELLKMLLVSGSGVVAVKGVEGLGWGLLEQPLFAFALPAFAFGVVGIGVAFLVRATSVTDVVDFVLRRRRV